MFIDVYFYLHIYISIIVVCVHVYLLISNLAQLNPQVLVHIKPVATSFIWSFRLIDPTSQFCKAAVFFSLIHVASMDEQKYDIINMYIIHM